MKKLMLIDAVHPEETRVALVNNGRIEDFDFETTGNEQLRGNIYLAKVTRVEPSLQACFVEYGGNRHGFLAFSEIHPDYYQLPQEDREALIEEAAREAAEADEDDLDDGEDDDTNDTDDDDQSDDIDASNSDDDGETEPAQAETTAPSASTAKELDIIDDANDDEDDSDASEEEASASNGEDDEDEDDAEKPAARRKPRQRSRKTRPSNATRRYKIQEVIRRRQVLLVQVVKEERGNKGAALTTYLSLAGRYSVLMPNTPRGGGISRKIASGNDRKRLKTIMNGLEVPKGMGLIVRTAGAKRTKSEIHRDYDYLQKLWSNIRGKTLKSMAPALIHEEGGLVHRAMRDMFDREIEEVAVQGDTAYREAKDLAKTLMPTQASKVKRWTAPNPLFVIEGVEDQLDSVFNPVVQMKSGGYLVINQTEALVAIDVNSGRSTKERSIEQTALRTNLEAAEEACRQMRLRDLAGLVVIDFIDMEENKNNRAVEKKMKDCLKLDRARVQNNRISQFGLMEISRQRRRAGVLQSTSEKCESCDGTGRRRSVPSAALQLLRAIEARIASGNLRGLTVTAPTDVALYILNAKREMISALEEDAGFSIAIQSSAEMLAGDFKLDGEKESGNRRRRNKFDRAQFLEGDADDHLLPDEDDDEDEEDVALDEDGNPAETANDNDDESAKPKRRRRGRRGGRRRRKDEDEAKTAIDPGTPPSDGGALLDGLSNSLPALLGEDEYSLPDASEGGLQSSEVALPSQAAKPAAQAEATPEDKTEASETEDGEPRRKRRRRRRRRGKSDEEATPVTAEGEAVAETSDAEAETSAPNADIETVVQDDPVTEEPPVTIEETAAPIEETPEVVEAEPVIAEEPAPEPVDEKPSVAAAVFSSDAPIATEPVLDVKPAAKKKRGWWSRG